MTQPDATSSTETSITPASTSVSTLAPIRWPALLSVATALVLAGAAVMWLAAHPQANPSVVSRVAETSPLTVPTSPADTQGESVPVVQQVNPFDTLTPLAVGDAVALKSFPSVNRGVVDLVLEGANPSPMTDSPVALKTTVVMFFQGVDCEVCEAQLKSFEAQKDTFAARGIQVVAITTDPPPTLMRWARAQKLSFPLVADPTQKLTRHFGVLNTMTNRPWPSVFMVDKASRVVAHVLDAQYKRLYADDVLARLQ